MNKLHKALIYDNQVSLTVLETTEMVNDAVKTHGLGEDAARTLGGFLTCAAYMAGCLKNDRGAVSLTVKPDGDAGAVSVSGDKSLHIRGYIDAECGGRIDGGYLTVIKDDGFFRPFIGMQYYDQSEQIPTAVAVGVKMRGGKCVAAGGVVMQLLPGTSQENMDRAEERMQAFVHAADVVEKYGADGIVKEFFSAELKDGPAYSAFPRK